MEGKVELRVEDFLGKGKVAHLTLDYRERINIVNTPLLLELRSAIESLHHDDDLRVMVLTGGGEKAFIGGADIREMVDLNPEFAREFITRLHNVCLAIREFPVPVIAKISGYCIGGGLEIAASCDLRVASEDSTFSMPEVRVGIPSVIEAAILPRLMGWGNARELIYTGETISAMEALSCGLVERVVAKSEIDAFVDRWVASILKCGPTAIRLQKRLFRAWENLPLDEAIGLGIKYFGEAYRTDEPKTMMEKFLKRERKPKD